MALQKMVSISQKKKKKNWLGTKNTWLSLGNLVGWLSLGSKKYKI